MSHSDDFETLDEARLTVRREFADALRRAELTTFESFFRDDAGTLLRDVGPRANIKLSLDIDGKKLCCFLKRHEPKCLLGWRVLPRPGRSTTPARTEWENIERLARLGIRTMRRAALGEDPATGRSFLLTVEIPSALPADDYARTHFTTEEKCGARRALSRRIGELARRLHQAELTHRDLYLCHIFVRAVEDDFQLHLIDLQRVGPRRFLRRWKVKDLAQLEYSRKPGTFTRTDGVRFLHAYFDTGCLSTREKRFIRSVLRKGKRMKRRGGGTP